MAAGPPPPPSLRFMNKDPDEEDYDDSMFENLPSFLPPARQEPSPFNPAQLSVSYRLPQSISPDIVTTTFVTNQITVTTTTTSNLIANPTPTTLLTTVMTTTPLPMTTLQQTMTAESSTRSTQPQTTGLLSSASLTTACGIAPQTPIAVGIDTGSSNKPPTNKVAVAVGASIGTITGAFALFLIWYLIFQYRRGKLGRARNGSYREMGEGPDPLASNNLNSRVPGVTLQNSMRTPVGVTFQRALPPPPYALSRSNMAEPPRISWHPAASPAITLAPSTADGLFTLPPTPVLHAMEDFPRDEGIVGNGQRGSRLEGGFSRLNQWLRENRRRSRVM